MKCLVNIIGFNRPQHLLRVINAIENEIINYQGRMIIDMSIIVDGKGDDFVKSWNKVVEISQNSNFPVKIRKENLGLRQNIMLTISEFKKSEYDTMILIEDDIVVSSGVFAYFEEMFIRYMKDNSVVQISGFSPVDLNKMAVFRHFRLSTWAWGVWQCKMPLVDDFLVNWSTFNIKNWANLHREILHYAPDLKRMLRYQKHGKINSWSLDFLVYMIDNNLYTLYPTRSLVVNIGHDGTGVNCRKNTLLNKGHNSTLLEIRSTKWSNVEECSNSTYSVNFKKYYTPNVIKRMSRFVYDICYFIKN
jgi:hypothetical protein